MLHYGKDELGKDILITPDNGQVMMEWERPYMEHCINTLFPSGDVLEIGFGLGYSANQIQKYPIKSHTIIECDTTVLKVAREWANNQPNPVNIIHGTWQNALNILGSFDYIFYDDYPINVSSTEYEQSFKSFFDRIRKFHLKRSTKIVWYCEYQPVESLIRWFNNFNVEYNISTFNIEKPSNLKYARWHENVMFVPELTIYK
jgi:guanidinoacetate N-methyltransferase